MYSSVAQGLSQAPATLAVTISRVCIEFTTSMNPATAPENAQATAQREAGTEAAGATRPGICAAAGAAVFAGTINAGFT